jgi:hypothetical protein
VPFESLEQDKASNRTTQAGPQVRKDRGEKKQLQCESGRTMEQAFKRNQGSKKCAAVQTIAEERVEIVGGGEKIGQKTTQKLQSTALKI